MSPRMDSVCSPPSPYIGDEDEHTESALLLSVCSLQPSRYVRLPALGMFASPLSKSPIQRELAKGIKPPRHKPSRVGLYKGRKKPHLHWEDGA